MRGFEALSSTGSLITWGDNDRVLQTQVRLSLIRAMGTPLFSYLLFPSVFFRTEELPQILPVFSCPSNKPVQSTAMGEIRGDCYALREDKATTLAGYIIGVSNATLQLFNPVNTLLCAPPLPIHDPIHNLPPHLLHLLLPLPRFSL